LLRSSGRSVPGGFAYAALLTQDVDTMYPKSRVEKLQGRCDIQSIFDDEVVTVGANAPSIYTQRIYWSIQGPKESSVGYSFGISGECRCIQLASARWAVFTDASDIAAHTFDCDLG
ncbi:hypothetical protein FOZ62_020875, partial [Perkinsus olseni]